ncbi:hypothetical protein [Stenotrophomonas pictorum]|uniref:hypothetical protein n=1 Tax=Stenotrophomonas pictorum TaxID=86184 RepID=UPI00130EBBD8|nr:hypothetical protein [Stenotrophomonas pictorum]
MSERSEFRAAPFREKRRAPMRLYRIGMRPAEAVLVPFAATKRNPAAQQAEAFALVFKS